MNLSLNGRFSQGQVTGIAKICVAVFAALGIIPLEIVIPWLAYAFHHQGLIFIALSLYFVIYVYGLSKSLRAYWEIDRDFFERNRVGRKFDRWLHRASQITYDADWYLIFKVWYYLSLVILGFLPFVVKFAIALCVFRPTPLSYGCVFFGTTLRAYVLTYVLTALAGNAL